MDKEGQLTEISDMQLSAEKKAVKEVSLSEVSVQTDASSAPPSRALFINESQEIIPPATNMTQ
jgi:hypothetical protein